MKKYPLLFRHLFYLFSTGVVLLCPDRLFSQNEPLCDSANVCEECTYFSWENALYLGPTFSYLSVEDKQDQDAGIPHRKFEGFVGGGEAYYERYSSNGLYGLLYTGFLTGQLDGESSSQNTMQAFESTTKARIGFSYSALQGKELRATPYIGLGFCFFHERVSSVDEDYFTVFLPVGFLLSYSAADWAYLGFELEWFPDLDTTLDSGDVEDKLRYVLSRESDQLQVRLPMQFLLSDYFSISVIPFWKQIKTAKLQLSNGTLIQPDQRRIYWGSHLHFSYLF